MSVDAPRASSNGAAAGGPDSLDPPDWPATRALAHQMLDDILDYVVDIESRPVWQPLPDDVRASFRSPLPRAAGDLARAYAEFQTQIVPYVAGNAHPRFMGWVNGGGNVVGMLAELLAAGINANVGGRDHAPVEVERQVIRWAAEMFGFPLDATGLLVTGSSMANFIGVLVARTAHLGPTVRSEGLAAAPLRAYASSAAHGCIARAIDMAGLGTDALQAIPCDDDFRIRLDALATAVAADRACGLQPFLVVGNAGAVDTGAVDDLQALSQFCQREKLWFHVDGAFGALAMLAPGRRAALVGMEQADSLAFDFHKWAQAPYDAGCVLVRDGAAHAAAFAAPAAYLRRETRGLAAGQLWPCDLGPDLSRGFRALKVWMALKVYGADQLGRVVEHTCQLATHLANCIDAEPRLKRVAPVALNIVCFRFVAADGELDQLNRDIVADLHETGIAVPSTTILHGQVVIRAAIVNHRTEVRDVEMLVAAVLAAGQQRQDAVTNRMADSQLSQSD